MNFVAFCYNSLSGLRHICKSTGRICKWYPSHWGHHISILAPCTLIRWFEKEENLWSHSSHPHLPVKWRTCVTRSFTDPDSTWVFPHIWGVSDFWRLRLMSTDGRLQARGPALPIPHLFFRCWTNLVSPRSRSPSPSGWNPFKSLPILFKQDWKSCLVASHSLTLPLSLGGALSILCVTPSK